MYSKEWLLLQSSSKIVVWDQLVGHEEFLEGYGSAQLPSKAHCLYSKGVSALLLPGNKISTSHGLCQIAVYYSGTFLY